MKNNFHIISTEIKFKNFIDKYCNNNKKFLNTANFFFYEFGFGCFFNITNNEQDFYVFNNDKNIKENVKFFIKKNKNINYIDINKKFNLNVNKDFSNMVINDIVVYSFNPDTYDPTNIMDNYDKIYYDMISNWNQNYKIKQCSYFLNICDCLINYKYKFNNYMDVIYNTKPNKNNNNFLPIINATTSPNFKHKLIPYIDAWLLANNNKKTIKKMHNREYKKSSLNIKWDNKINKIFFRGTVTGAYFNNIKLNQRLKFAKFLDNLRSKNNYIYNLFDFSLYSNNDDTLIEKNKLIKFDYKKVSKNFKKPKELFNREKNYNYENFKFILVIDGMVNAWRIPKELSFNSVLLIVDSEYDYKTWFENNFKPYVHYIPIKKDLSNVVIEINKLIKDDLYAKRIANNGYKFYKNNFSKKDILEYINNNF